MIKLEKILKDRENIYGYYPAIAELTQKLNDIICTGSNYKNLSYLEKETFYRILNKLARLLCGDFRYIDNIVDIIGYGTLLKNKINDKIVDGDRKYFTHEDRLKYLEYSTMYIDLTNTIKKSPNYNKIPEDRTNSLTILLLPIIWSCVGRSYKIDRIISSAESFKEFLNEKK